MVNMRPLLLAPSRKDLMNGYFITETMSEYEAMMMLYLNAGLCSPGEFRSSLDWARRSEDLRIISDYSGFGEVASSRGSVFRWRHRAIQRESKKRLYV